MSVAMSCSDCSKVLFWTLEHTKVACFSQRQALWDCAAPLKTQSLKGPIGLGKNGCGHAWVLDKHELCLLSVSPSEL